MRDIETCADLSDLEIEATGDVIAHSKGITSLAEAIAMVTKRPVFFDDVPKARAEFELRYANLTADKN